MKMNIHLGICICLVGSLAAQESNVDFKQDVSGVYKFTFETPKHSRKEERDIHGTITGEYTITNDDGVKETFTYESGVNGFKILSGNLPIAPVDYNLQVVEPFELIEERRKHLDLHRMWSANPQSFVPEVIGQLEETSEVMEARRQHLKLYKQWASMPKSFLPKVMPQNFFVPQAMLVPHVYKPEGTPIQVQETDEVKKAKEDFLKNYKAQLEYFESVKKFKKMVSKV